MPVARCVLALSSAAILLTPGTALSVQSAPSPSVLQSVPSPSLFFGHYSTPKPTLRPLAADFEADKDGLIPEHPTYESDLKTRVVTPLTAEDMKSQQDDIFMRYMPRQNVVMCGCGKCGSTSMLEYTYDQLFPTTWRDTWKGHGPPYVQEVLSERWNETFKMVPDEKGQEAIMNKAFSFAIIRDPKDRLVSAWKSKLACENWYGVDLYDRSHYDGYWHQYRGFVAQLQRLRGQDENITCMNLEMFAEALLDIKRLGRSHYLDRHFLAQDLGCFSRFPPSRWSKVAAIKDDGAFKELAEHLDSENSTVPIMHNSPARVMVTDRALELLNEVTADEYAMLQPYLTEESKIKANKWNLLRIH